MEEDDDDDDGDDDHFLIKHRDTNVYVRVVIRIFLPFTLVGRLLDSLPLTYQPPSPKNRELYSNRTD
jgi:hypothetical protein